MNLGWWLITLHSTITWLTLTRSLDGSDGKIKTLTLYSDPYPYTNQNHYPNHNPNPNEKLYLFPYMVMSRDITWPKQFLPVTCQGSFLTLRHVIRNQRSKIRRSNIISTAGTLLEKSRNSSVEWFSTLGEFALDRGSLLGLGKPLLSVLTDL